VTGVQTCALPILTFIRFSCISGSAEPSGVLELPRIFQLSPRSPSASVSSPSSRIRRLPTAGRQTIISTRPVSAGAALILSSPDSNPSRLLFAPSAIPGSSCCADSTTALLRFDSRSDFMNGQSIHFHHLLWRRFTSNDTHRALRQRERLGHHALHQPVGFALFRWSGYPHLEGIAQPTADL